MFLGTSDCDGESALNVPRAEGALILALRDCVNAVLAQHRVHARQDEYCAPLVHAHLQGTGQVVPGFGEGLGPSSKSGRQHVKHCSVDPC